MEKDGELSSRWRNNVREKIELPVAREVRYRDSCSRLRGDPETIPERSQN